MADLTQIRNKFLENVNKTIDKLIKVCYNKYVIKIKERGNKQ